MTYATEAALWGGLSELLDNTVILSDDAGQFNVGLHALCWIHAERHMPKLHASGERNRQAVESKRDEIWIYYRQLLDCCRKPQPKVKQSLLQRFADNKSELLRSLDFPCTPLHNNQGYSENLIIPKWSDKAFIQSLLSSNNSE